MHAARRGAGTPCPDRCGCQKHSALRSGRDMPAPLHVWSRRGLNPRPNRETLSFLHAYLRLVFDRTAETRATRRGLILYKLQPKREAASAYLRICCTATRNASERGLSARCLVPAHRWQELSRPTVLQTKQRERKSFRQLNFREPRLKCPPTSALHAYPPLRPAVKSSLPLVRVVQR